MSAPDAYRDRAVRGEVPAGTVTGVIEEFLPGPIGMESLRLRVAASDVDGIAPPQTVLVVMPCPADANFLLRDLLQGYGELDPVPTGSLVTFHGCGALNDDEIEVSSYDVGSIDRAVEAVGLRP